MAEKKTTKKTAAKKKPPPEPVDPVEPDASPELLTGRRRSFHPRESRRIRLVTRELSANQ